MIASLETNYAASGPRPEQITFSSSRRQVVPGSAAENKMVEQHLPLVKMVVGQLAMSLSSQANPDDLYSSGLVGLLDAVRKFDPQAGSSFESYARVRIRGAVLDELRRMDWVPRSIHDKARKVQAVVVELEQALGRSPTDAEIAQALKISPGKYGELMEEIRPAAFVCLDSTPTAEWDGEEDRHESIADESQEDPMAGAARRELVGLIAARLQVLPQMQRQVLALYYFEDMRLREIAATFGVTESRICQIHAQALRSLRVFLQKQGAVAA